MNCASGIEHVVANLQSAMAPGDVIAFDAFCIGAEYEVSDDPMLNPKLWSGSLQAFLLRGIKLIEEFEETARPVHMERIEPVPVFSDEGLGRMLRIEAQDKLSGKSLMTIRRPAPIQVMSALSKQGFSEVNQISISPGPLERLIFYAKMSSSS